MKTITEEQFESSIQSNNNVIIQFSANWCGPCKQLTPILDSFAEGRESVSVFKVDVGESSELAKRYSVMHIPKMIVFKDGKKHKESVGLVSKEKMENLIK